LCFSIRAESPVFTFSLFFSFGNNRYFHGFLITLHIIIVNFVGLAIMIRIKDTHVEKDKTGKWLAGEVG
jgi:hypothetical protein